MGLQWKIFGDGTLRTGGDDFEIARRKHIRALAQLDEARSSESRRCLHLGCPTCFGTGRKADGTPCVHMISCPCPRCSPRM